MLNHADDQAANDIDRKNHNAGNGVAFYEFRRTVHRTIEIGLAGNVFATFACDIGSDDSGIEIGVDCHLFAGHGVKREARGDF